MRRPGVSGHHRSRSDGLVPFSFANVGIAGKSCLERMSSASNATDAAVIRAFAGIPALLEQAPALIARGRFLDCECLLGPIDHPFHVSIRAGRIVDLTPAPVLMRSWRFSYRATTAAWAEYWQSAPRPGWHDLLALTKRGEADAGRRFASLHDASAVFQGRAGAAAAPVSRCRHDRPYRADGRPLRPCRDRRRDASHLFRGERQRAFRWCACIRQARTGGSGGICSPTRSLRGNSASSRSTCPGMANPIRRRAGTARNTG